MRPTTRALNQPASTPYTSQRATAANGRAKDGFPITPSREENRGIWSEDPIEQIGLTITIASGMRVLLQNTETKLYFVGPNEWTSDSARALDFEEIERASEVFNNQNLDYAQIVLDPEGPHPKSEGGEDPPNESGFPQRPGFFI